MQRCKPALSTVELVFWDAVGQLCSIPAAELASSGCHKAALAPYCLLLCQRSWWSREGWLHLPSPLHSRVQDKQSRGTASSNVCFMSCCSGCGSELISDKARIRIAVNCALAYIQAVVAVAWHPSLSLLCSWTWSNGHTQGQEQRSPWRSDQQSAWSHLLPASPLFLPCGPKSACMEHVL